MALFTNQATLTYNDNVINSNIVTGEIVQVLTVTKNALSDTYERDKTITSAHTLSTQLCLFR